MVAQLGDPFRHVRGAGRQAGPASRPSCPVGLAPPAVDLAQQRDHAAALRGCRVEADVGRHQVGASLIKPVEQPDQLAEGPRHRLQPVDEQRARLAGGDRLERAGEAGVFAHNGCQIELVG